MLDEPPTSFFINPTNSTPFVEFDLKQGKLDIIGKRAPDASADFYNTINAQVDDYLNNRGDVLNVNISFEEFDSLSDDGFVNFLKRIKSLDKNQTDIRLNWYYDEVEDVDRKSLEYQMNDLGIRYEIRSYCE
ncbi:MAG: SiaC family regulatory phosphoprotein [Cyclobacteriaceae bacterium]